MAETLAQVTDTVRGADKLTDPQQGSRLKFPHA